MEQTAMDNEQLAAELQRIREMQARSMALQAERQRELCGEYGQDRWERGRVLIFKPGPGSKDQEVRAAVKIGQNEWTMTARGGSRTWGELLTQLGSGKIMRAAGEYDPGDIPEL